MMKAKNITKMSHSEQQEKAIELLAFGTTIDEAAKELGISARTIIRWRNDIDFRKRLDEVTLTAGVALKAERLRMVNRITRKLASQRKPTTKDLLDWLKFAQSETDGSKVDVTTNGEKIQNISIEQSAERIMDLLEIAKKRKNDSIS